MHAKFHQNKSWGSRHTGRTDRQRFFIVRIIKIHTTGPEHNLHPVDMMSPSKRAYLFRKKAKLLLFTVS